MPAGYLRTSVIGLTVLLAATAAVAEDKLYLAEYKYNDPRLYRMNLDGSSVDITRAASDGRTSTAQTSKR